MQSCLITLKNPISPTVQVASKIYIIEGRTLQVKALTKTPPQKRHGYVRKAVPRRGRKLNMPRRLPDKTRDMPREPRKYGSQMRFRLSRPIFALNPVKENQELEVVIDDIGSRGDGIAKIQGFMIFVPGSKVGDQVRVKILSVADKFAVAEKIDHNGE
jgi:predicted RNA-binding protein with TRAM domain